MSEFIEDLTIQSLQRKLKTAMEIADSATIIVLEREKQIKDLEQQLKTARKEQAHISYEKGFMDSSAQANGSNTEYMKIVKAASRHANNLEGK